MKPALASLPLRFSLAALSMLVLPNLLWSADSWQMVKGPLATRWAKQVTPDHVHAEYPRPTLVRKDWLTLNGLWDYAIVDKKADRPEQFQGQILVPFPIESALSGVMKQVGETNQLWYRRKLTIPAGWKGQKILLHFGAVDWEATVYANGQNLATHRGGYDGFSVDLTPALRSTGEQEIVVAVWDPTDSGTQPRGKQVRKPHAIWYTPTSGIWQSVWIEPVAATSIAELKQVPDVDAGALRLTVQLRGNVAGAIIRAVVRDDGQQISTTEGKPSEEFKLTIPTPKLWSPDRPHLYDLQITVVRGGEEIDRASSYFGMRKIALGRDADGTLRLQLNNQALFQFGPLDQGFWPDGLYTAPSDEALRSDIEMTKQLGFNMARKHVKVEPERWYYWCDKLGLLVWQDMPSGDRYISPREPDIKRSPESAQQFELELKRLMEGRGNHPCIVAWVPFNEGWGQYDTPRIAALVKERDPSRLVINASGWADRACGDIMDIHVYPGPRAPKIESQRAGVLGEFGGLGLPVSGHTWQAEKNWGYRSYETSSDLTTAYLNLIRKLRPLAGKPGLSAAVYTQTTDVEIEVNGLLTYDRERVKMDEQKITAANRKLYLPPPPPPTITVLSPTAQEQPIDWRYTTDKPADEWMNRDFADTAWRQGPGGFGEPSTPGTTVRTQWKTKDIWLRRQFDVPPNFRPHSLQLVIFHDEDAEIYLNGTQVGQFSGHIGAYDNVMVDEQKMAALRPGKNVLAVHCRQTTGGQYIDVGVWDVIEHEAGGQ